MNNDLTKGNPSKVLIKFALPLFGSIIFQQLYNLADSFVAGNFIDESALAAVGNSYEITLIFLAFAFGCNIGCSVIVSKLFGAKKIGEMKTAIFTALIFSGALCLVLMAAGFLFGQKLFLLINTPQNLVSDSWLYLKIYIAGLPFVFFYNLATGIFSALGDSKTPFIFLALSSTANIAADVLFVTAFHMRVDGVAWATFLCQGVSCILAVTVVFIRLAKIKSEEKSEFFSFRILKTISVIAIPSILQQSFISVGNIILQSIINNFGERVMAGYSSAIKLNNLVITSLTTLGNGISNFTAQNIGANKLYRVKKGFSCGVKLVWIICIPICLLYVLLSKQLIQIFVNKSSTSEECLITGRNFLLIVSPCYFIVALKLVADGVLRGSGMMKKFTIATFTDLILRVIFAKLFSMTPLEETGIWLAWPIGWIIATAMSYIFYRSGKWKNIKDDEQEAENRQNVSDIAA